jgi:hypothetical protein
MLSSIREDWWRAAKDLIFCPEKPVSAATAYVLATEISNDPAGPLAREYDVAAADGPLWTARRAQANRYYSGLEWRSWLCARVLAAVISSKTSLTYFSHFTTQT